MNLSSQSGKSAFELVEEAAHLVRTAPAATLAAYYLGSIPFVAGFLYFWSDMSRSPFAGQHAAEAALFAALLFLLMKFSHAVFAQRLLAQVAGRTAPPLTAARIRRMLFRQAVIQPTGLFLIPIALVSAVPFAWVYAFYQNVTALDDGETSELAALSRRAWKQAALWPYQNHIVLAALLLFGVCVFLNWFVVALALPQLLKMLFGIESAFSRSAVAMINSTVMTSMLGLTYLVLDPVVKAAYVLRTFYGESLTSGEDLKSNLRQFAAAAQQTLLLLCIVCVFACGALAQAQPGPAPQPAPPSGSPAVSPAELDRSIDGVIHETKYAWRLPRAPAEAAEKGMLSQFLEDAGSLVVRAVRAVVNWIVDRIEAWLKRTQVSGGGGVVGWMMSSGLLYFLLLVVIAVLAMTLHRVWRNHGRRSAPLHVEAIPYTPDVADENVRADELPHEEWLALGRRLLERGELRLAMRAFYLSSLADLGRQNLIAIARFKSNRDYETELRRRAHAIPGLAPVFSESVSSFERVWYGMYEVDAEAVRHFAANLQAMSAMRPREAS